MGCRIVKEIVYHFLVPPFVLVAGLLLSLCWFALTEPRRGGKMVAAWLSGIFAGLLLICLIPATAKFLEAPFPRAAPEWLASTDEPFDAVVVPTGGAFLDPTGEPWPTNSSIRRVTLAASLAREFGVPLVVSGGMPSPERVPFSEAEVVVDRLELDRNAVLIDPDARTSYETAQNVAKMLLPRGQRRVLLVTDVLHLPRMAASLRAAGFLVYAETFGLSRDHPITAEDFIPSNRGMSFSRRIMGEYAAIIGYLALGRFSVDDLTSGLARRP